MTMSVHQYLCLTDNYGALIHDQTTGATACVDVPEAGPTLAALAERGWNLTDILITHHHADHIQGVPDVRAKFPNAKIWGPAKDAARIPFLDRKVKEGDTAEVGSLESESHRNPRPHARSYRLSFRGQTQSRSAATRCFPLVAAACSRRRLRSCGARWPSSPPFPARPKSTAAMNTLRQMAGSPSPSNPTIRSSRLGSRRSRRLRAERRPTLPTTIAAELAANPFLRVEEPAIQAAVGMGGAEPAAVFGELRARKDRF